jgi:4-amino-4-deoxy-L-arabinose transferase-like glycosyltransferase
MESSLSELTSRSVLIARPWRSRVVTLAIVAATLIGLLLRFAYISAPPYDWHAFRQTQTLSTIEAFFRDGLDFLHPRTLYMGYPGVFVLELPIFQAFCALLYHAFGPHLEIVRIVNIFIGAGTAWVLYLAIAHLLDRPTAILTALIYWLAPLNVIYQRSTLIDPLGVFCGILSFYTFSVLAIPRAQLGTLGPTRIRAGFFLAFVVSTWFAAMIKALYLWPSTLLFGWAYFTRKLKWDARMASFFAVFMVSGFSFLLWNRYAARVNDLSPFTRGVRPTSLLGMSALIDPEYYLTMIVRRPKWWLGLVPVLLYPVGLLAVWKQRRLARTAVLLLLIFIPPTYLVVFSFINRPHDYYQLIIAPFLAVIPANAILWLASPCEEESATPEHSLKWAFLLCGGILLSTPLVYLFWAHGGRPDARNLAFERLCAGKISRGTTGMLFVAEGYTSATANSDLPQFLYAAGLWGCARVVKNDSAAKQYFDEFGPAFSNLEYVVFCGLARPLWTPLGFSACYEDPSQNFYVFRRAGVGLKVLRAEGLACTENSSSAR